MSFLAQKLPLSWGYSLAILSADLVYAFWPDWRKYAKESMAHALGKDASPKQVASAARKSIRNYFKFIVEFLRFPRLRQEDMAKQIMFSSWDNLDKAFQEGKGVILIGLHMGNWDLAAAAVAVRKYPLNVIVNAFGSQSLTQIAGSVREKLGMKLIPRNGGARKLAQALRKNEMVALLIDQPEADSCLEVQFLGEPARVPAGAATLALKTGARVIIGGMVRLPNNRFLGLLDEPTEFKTTDDFQQNVLALTQSIMASLEKMVKSYPDQWYMFRPMWGNHKC
ncbi:MAG: lysophospholipid acyltransferase family protein [Chloroflexi bacterium]|nr:lysophospholipid acyltransferase family protein [Chloroflexota bacterium]